MRFSGRSRPLRIGEFFFYHQDDSDDDDLGDLGDNDDDENNDYDDCRYDQSTAEAFRAVQKSGEMVLIRFFYHSQFFCCHFKIPHTPQNTLKISITPPGDALRTPGNSCIVPDTPKTASKPP